MRKYLGILLAMTMATSMIFSASAVWADAEEEAPAAVELNWSDFEQSVEESEMTGDFVTFDEIAVKMWVPTALQQVELTDEDTEAGYIGYFMTEDESAAVAVMYVDVDGMDLDAYKEYLEGVGATSITDVTLNGLPGVGYDLAENDSSSFAFTTEMGYILEVTFSPVSDEGFSSIVTIMAASIQAAEDEVEEEAAE